MSKPGESPTCYLCRWCHMIRLNINSLDVLNWLSTNRGICVSKISHACTLTPLCATYLICNPYHWIMREELHISREHAFVCCRNIKPFYLQCIRKCDAILCYIFTETLFYTNLNTSFKKRIQIRGNLLDSAYSPLLRVCKQGKFWAIFLTA